MGSRVFFLSDLHLGHNKLVEFRSNVHGILFQNVDEMDEWLIDNINSVVRPKDILWLLGDVAFGECGKAKLCQLNGHKRLVMGNHDMLSIQEVRRDFEQVHGVTKKYGMVMSHVPIHPQELAYRWNFNLHGHIHHKERDIKDDRYMNMNVDIVGPRPIQLEDLRERMEKVNDKLESIHRDRT